MQGCFLKADESLQKVGVTKRVVTKKYYKKYEKRSFKKQIMQKSIKKVGVAKRNIKNKYYKKVLQKEDSSIKANIKANVRVVSEERSCLTN